MPARKMRGRGPNRSVCAVPTWSLWLRSRDIIFSRWSPMGLGNQLQDQMSSSIMQELILGRLHLTVITLLLSMLPNSTFIWPCLFKGNQKDKSDGAKVNAPPNSPAAHSLDLYTSTDFKSYATPLTWFGSPTPDLTIMGKCLILKSQTLKFTFTKTSCFTTTQLSTSIFGNFLLLRPTQVLKSITPSLCGCYRYPSFLDCNSQT